MENITREMVEERLKAVLPALPADKVYSTAGLALLITSEDQLEKTCWVLLRLASRHPELCERGPERPGRGYAKGRTIQPRLWRRIDADTLAAMFTAPPHVSGEHRESRLDRLEAAMTDLQRRVAQLEGPNGNQA